MMKFFQVKKWFAILTLVFTALFNAGTAMAETSPLCINATSVR